MKERDGDLLKMFGHGEFDVIIHGCNCFHTMGAGIAGQIAERFPQAVVADRDNSAYGDVMKLSNNTMVDIDGKLIVNLYSQYLPGKNLDKNALLLGFWKLSKVLDPKARIGIPAIGCGIAGGDWEELGPLIADIMRDKNLTYVKYSAVVFYYPPELTDIKLSDLEVEETENIKKEENGTD